MAEEDIRYSDGPIIGLPLLEAAGGLVINNGRLLCIKKHGLWDLPKGKLDPGESLEACARRETCEETGLKIDSLLIKDHYETSEYIQRYSGKDFHKVVHWYTMDYISGTEGILSPSMNEGIEECRWINLECLRALNMLGYAASISKNIAYEFSF